MKIYIAAPLFSDGERQFNEQIDAVIRAALRQAVDFGEMAAAQGDGRVGAVGELPSQALPGAFLPAVSAHRNFDVWQLAGAASWQKMPLIININT